MYSKLMVYSPQTGEREKNNNNLTASLSLLQYFQMQFSASQNLMGNMWPGTTGPRTA